MMSAGDVFLFGATSMLGWSILQAAPRAVTAFCNGYTRRVPTGIWLRYRHRQGLPMTLVADELRSAMWAEDAARRVWELAHADVTGIRLAQGIADRKGRDRRTRRAAWP